MNTLQAIAARKSVRSYTGEPVDSGTLQSILAAAQAAPVGMGKFDSMHLTVITSKALLDEIEKNTQAAFGAARPVLYGAPTLVLVSTKLTGAPMDNVAYSNAAGIVENMALTATELGVGACHIWGAVMTMQGNPALVQKLGLPEGFTPVCGIILGKTDYAYAERAVPSDRIAVDTIA